MMRTKKEKPLRHYYEILGLEEGASLEEIIARWLELKKQIQFTPERNIRTNKRIKEINEAYRKLKASFPPAGEFDLGEYLKELVPTRKAERKAAKKKMIILSSSILTICLISGAFFFILTRLPGTVQHPSITQDDPNRIARESIEETATLPPLESKTPVMITETAPQEPRKTAISESASQVPISKELPTGFVSGGREAEVREKPPAPPALNSAPPVEAARVVPQEPSKATIPESSKPVPIFKESPQVSIPPSAPPALKPAPPVEAARVVPQEPSKINIPESAKTTSLPSPPSALASEMEVLKFFEDFVNRYNSKSIEGFISFFSPKAIQNQKDNFEKIRRIYDNFFDQMETVQYQIAINKIEPHQNSVEVRGLYQLEGIVSKGRKKQNWKGQVRWVLVRENGALKILSLDYEPQN